MINSYFYRLCEMRIADVLLSLSEFVCFVTLRPIIDGHLCPHQFSLTLTVDKYKEAHLYTNYIRIVLFYWYLFVVLV